MKHETWVLCISCLVMLIISYYKLTRLRCALLICTVNSDERRAMHQDVIRWWIQYKRKYLHYFDIFIVDSTNNRFDMDIETACKICRFDQSQVQGFQTYKGNTTWMEMKALEHAISCFGTTWESEFTHFIKLTGKYKLPRMINIMLQAHISCADIFLQQQHRHEDKWQNSEFIMLKTSILKSYWNQIYDYLEHNASFNMERAFYTLVHENNKKYFYKIHRIGRIINIARYKRSDGAMLYFL